MTILPHLTVTKRRKAASSKRKRRQLDTVLPWLLLVALGLVVLWVRFFG